MRPRSPTSSSRRLADAAHLEVIRDGDTVVARTNLGRERRVVIAGHLDTVPINDNLPTRFETIDGERYLWGRGTVDMKGGVAVQLKLARSSPIPSSTSRGCGTTTRSLGRAERPRAARAASPRPLHGRLRDPRRAVERQVEGGCNGNLRFELRAYGLRALPPAAGSATTRSTKLAPALDRLAAYEAETIEVDGLAYREGLNAVGITGGVAGNVIPDEAMLHVNYRFAPNRTVAEAIEFARAMFPEYELTVVDAAEGARRASTRPSRSSSCRPSAPRRGQVRLDGCRALQRAPASPR